MALKRVKLSIGNFITQLVDEKKSVLSNALRRVSQALAGVEENVHELDKRLDDLPNELLTQGLSRIYHQHFFLTSDHTFTIPGFLKPYDVLIVTFEQDSTGGWNVTWPAGAQFPKWPAHPDAFLLTTFVFLRIPTFNGLRLLLPPLAGY